MSQTPNAARATILHNDRMLSQTEYDSTHESLIGSEVPYHWLNSFPHIVWVADAQGSVTYLNQRWQNITNHNIQDFLGLNLFQVVHPLDRDRVLQQWKQAVKAQCSFKTELRLKLASGEYCSMVASASPVSSQANDSPQEAIAWIGTLIELHPSVQIEQPSDIERELHSIITQNMAEGLCLVRLRDSRIIYANPKFEQMFGYQSGELNGQPLTVLNHQMHLGESSDLHKNIAQQIIQLGASTYELQTFRKDGTPFWCKTTTSIVKHPKHGTLLVAVQQDITQRKQADIELHQLKLELEERVTQRTAQLVVSNQRYAALTKISPVGIFRTGRLGEYLYVNDRWCELAGLESEKAYGFGWSQNIHPSDREKVTKAWHNAIQGKKAFQLEYRFQHHNGKSVFVFAQVTPETDEAGNSLGYIGTITDITALKESEEALRESEERFRATFEQAPIGVAQVDMDGHWLRVNQKLCDILGYSREELFTKTFQAITHPDDLDADLNLIEHLLLGDTSGGSLEKRYICKNGSWIWVNVTVSLVRDSDGSPKYFVGIIEDINERKRVEDERKRADLALQERATELTRLNALLATTATLLEERNRELDQFAYVASHDLKAPLRAIANLSEWIEEDLDGQLPEENQQQMKLLRGRVHRMEALINGLLQYSRIGRTKASIEVINVAETLTDVLDSLDPPKTFTIEVAPNMPTFRTRGLLLRQVFANLLSNAIKHHDRSDGRVTVSVEDQGATYEFSISDDGPGIAPEFHDRIFVIFQTLDARDTKENTGVGLSIVKKIVESEGGQITIDSQVGQGTTFRFTWLKCPQPTFQ